MVKLFFLTLLVMHVNCNQWEQINQATWQTEAGAQVFATDLNADPVVDFSVSVPGPARVTEDTAPSLYWELVADCRDEDEGGLFAAQEE